MRKTHAILIAVFFVAYFATFLPNLGLFNSLTWVGPLPLPMAWVIGLNALNTVLVVIVYRKYFKPYADRMATEEAALAGASPGTATTETAAETGTAADTEEGMR